MRFTDFRAEIAVAGNNTEELLPLFEKVDVVINIARPFTQIGWPIVKAALATNCHYLDTTGEHMINPIVTVITGFNEQAGHLSKEEKEAWTNAVGDQMDAGEPPKDDIDVLRSVIVCHGQGRQVTKTFAMNLSAPYIWTGDICAEAAQRLLSGQAKKAGQSLLPHAETTGAI